MKKVFQIIGLISLVCFSFFVTEKTSSVVNDMDEIMIKIKDNYTEYNVDSSNAIIKDNTIIPGVYGKKVNINMSYKNMKQSGYYSENLYIYDYIKPKISLYDNKDKYIISGNKTKRMVSLVFIVKNNNINNVLKIIDKNDIKVNFFINEEYLTNNNDLILNLISKNHIIGCIENNYEKSTYNWMNTILKKVGKQKNGYCYNIDSNKSNLEACNLLGNYTIKPEIVSPVTPLIDIKSSLIAGSIISVEINSNLEKELQNIISYIKSKGYVIVNLDELLKEKKL